jgi:hypothetical protein
MQFEKEIQKIVSRIIADTTVMEAKTDSQYDLDEEELRRYLDLVINEVKKNKVPS